MPTFYNQFQDSARKSPNKVALELQRKDDIESVTFSQLTHMAESVGRWLSERLPQQSRVAILAANHPLWAALSSL